GDASCQKRERLGLAEGMLLRRRWMLACGRLVDSLEGGVDFPDQLVDRALAVSAVDREDLAVPSDDKEMRNRFDRVLFGDVAGGIPQQGELPPSGFGHLLYFVKGFVTLLEADRQDRGSGFSQLLLHVLQNRQLLAAGGTPGRPEREEDELALLSAQTDLFIGEKISRLEIGRHRADTRWLAFSVNRVGGDAARECRTRQHELPAHLLPPERSILRTVNEKGPRKEECAA